MLKKSIIYLVALFISLVSFNVIVRADQPQITVLLYHHILPAAENKPHIKNSMVISRELFASHMEYLYNNQYHTITSDELRAYLYEKKPLPAKSVMLTFDDGYMSSYMFAYPILKQYGFKAVVFTLTSGIQTQDYDYRPDKADMLSWVQIAASADVFEYGSHTNALHSIENGKTGFVSVSLDEAQADLKFSQKRINNKKLFAYPLGQYNTQLVDMLKNNNIDLAFTINEGYINQNSNPMLLNRITVYPNFDLETFESVVTCNNAYK